LTSKQISNPSGTTDLPGNLVATSTYQLIKYPHDNGPLTDELEKVQKIEFLAAFQKL
jgi:hypothetical protein